MNEYTTVSVVMETGDVPQVYVSLRPNADAWFEASMSPDGTPLLTLQHAHAHVHLWPSIPSEVTEADVAVARRLVAAVMAYLADLERVHAERADTAV